MKISNIKIENFKSIESANIAVADFSIFVGQNNHGKTNIFNAIEWFYNTKSEDLSNCFQRDVEKSIRIEIEYVDVEDEDYDRLVNSGTKTKFIDLIGGQTKFSIYKSSSNDFKRIFIVDGEEKQNPTGIDTAINEFLPKIVPLHTSTSLEEIAKYKDKNLIGQMLSSVTSALVENDPEYMKFIEGSTRLFSDEKSPLKQTLIKLANNVSQHLKMQFPEGIDVEFTIQAPEPSDALKNFETQINDGIQTSAANKGDGMQRALMLAIIQTWVDFRKQEFRAAPFLFLIDEAELHLHPSAQRLLKTSLLEISNRDQVMINSHSSVLASGEYDNQKLFKVLKVDNVTSISEVRNNEKADLIFELLGGSPADIFFPRNFLIVEGYTDHLFMSMVLEKFYFPEFSGIKILKARGEYKKQSQVRKFLDETLTTVLSETRPVYGDKVVLLLDGVNEQQTESFKKFKETNSTLFTNDRIFLLSETSLEEYYPIRLRDEFSKLLANGKGLSKVDKAKFAGNSITKNEFENEMPIIYQALKRCNELAFR